MRLLLFKALSLALLLVFVVPLNLADDAHGVFVLCSGPKEKFQVGLCFL